MQPVIPHMISECLTKMGEETNFTWPNVDEKYLDKKTINIVVQIDGKKRGLILCDIDIDEKKLIKKIQETEDLKKYFLDKSIIKNIYIKNKLINFILK